MKAPNIAIESNSINVVFVLLDSMLATSATLPSEMLVAAEHHHRLVNLKKHRKSSSLKLTMAGNGTDSVKCQTGILLASQQNIETVEAADIIFLPALWRNPQKIVSENTKVVAKIAELYNQGSIICGVGTGCCLMAEAGILDHKPATTHWHYFEQFAKHYPLVNLQKHYFITQAGTCYCAASLNSLADLTVHIIKRFYGKKIAQKVERHFSQEIRKDYETMSFLENEANHHPDELILQAQMELQSHFSKNINLDELARQLGMSSRNFSRRFKQATGKTPSHYLLKIRMEHAKELLQSSNLSIIEVAYRTGFNDGSYFSAIFKREYSHTPKDYRTSIRAKLFSNP